MPELFRDVQVQVLPFSEPSDRFAALRARRGVAGAVALATITGLYLGALATAWGGPISVPVSDSVSYIRAGQNLLSGRGYLSAFGTPETWFPPSYPALIALASRLFALEAFLAARLVSVASALVVLLLTYAVARAGAKLQRTASLAAVFLLAANPLHQLYGASAMSESLTLAFSFGALCLFVLTMDGHRESSTRWILIGVLSAAAYLSRPETLIQFALLCVIAAVLLGLRAARRPLALSLLAFAVVAAPYVVWLSANVGRPVLTDKTSVNLAQGRGQFYGMPSYIIDEATLSIRHPEFPITAASEVRRYVGNAGAILRGYVQVYTLPGALALFMLVAVGGPRMYRERRHVALALAASLAYLPAIAVFSMTPRFLHASIPALTLFAVYGAWPPVRAAAPLWKMAIVGVLALASVETATRYPRWFRGETPPATALLREAGIAARQLAGGDTVFEEGATVAYYSGRTRGRVAASSLPTFARFLATRYAGRQPLVVVTNLEGGGKASPLRGRPFEPPPGWEPVLTLRRESDFVSIYRVDVPAARPQTSLAVPGPIPPAPLE